MQFQLEQAIEVLASTPDVLRALLLGKSDLWLQSRKAPDAFNAFDVLGHLMHAERADWIPRVRIILDNRNSAAITAPSRFEPFDRFDFQDLIADKSIAELLDGFAELRAQSLHALRAFNLTQRDFELEGRHPELGNVTLGNLLATWAVHDMGHITQILKTMANEYRQAVGPWIAYTTILH